MANNKEKNPFDLNIILEDAKKFKDVVVLGFDENNNLHIKTTVNNFPFVHYALNRGTFEVALIEKNLSMKKTEDTSDTEEVTI